MTMVAPQDDVIERAATVIVAFRDGIVSALETVPEQQLPDIAEQFVVQATGGPDNHYTGRRITMWDEAAAVVRAEFFYRKTLRLARESGLECYCVTCEGSCRGDAAHEARDRALPAMMPDECEVEAMSREELILEVHRLRTGNTERHFSDREVLSMVRMSITRRMRWLKAEDAIIGWVMTTDQAVNVLSRAVKIGILLDDGTDVWPNPEFPYANG